MIFVLAIIVPALAVSSCGEKHGIELKEPDIRATADSVTIRLNATSKVRQLDCFIYSDEGTRPLLSYRRLLTGLPCCLKEEKGDRTLVLIANAPGEFNLKALQSMDSMEKFQMDFGMEDEEYPVKCACSGLENDCTIELQSLLCEIVLVRVGQELGNMLRVEDPLLRLENVNDSAELLRKDGFRPIQTRSDTLGMRCPSLICKALPCDIGERDQFPDIHLYCYPNDETEATIGTPRTRLRLEGKIGGEVKEFLLTLPALKRAEVLHFELDIARDCSCSWKSY